MEVFGSRCSPLRDFSNVFGHIISPFSANPIIFENLVFSPFFSKTSIFNANRGYKKAKWKSLGVFTAFQRCLTIVLGLTL